MTLEKSRKMIGVFIVLIIAAGLLQVTAYADGGKQRDIYIDGTAASDGGGTQTSPHNNMESAMAAAAGAAADECVIWIMGAVTINGDVTWDFSDVAYDHVILKRHEEYTDLLVNITGGSKLTLTGAVMDGNKEKTEAAQPMIHVNGTLLLKDTCLQNNANVATGGGNGGAVYVSGTGEVKCESGQITGNEAFYGGGVHLSGGSMQLNGGEISYNEAEFGGGVEVNTQSDFTMSGGVIQHNVASQYGGGLEVTNGSCVVLTEDGEIMNNTAQYGGGLFVESAVSIYGDCEFRMTGGSIGNNETKEHGGGIYLGFEASAVLEQGEITGNQAEGSGGGIYIRSGGGTFEMSGGSISGNETKKHGGGIYAGASFKMTGGSISKNTITDTGTDCYGGGIYLCEGLELRIESGVISENKGYSGGGIYADTGCTITTYENSQINNNSASNGAGVYLSASSLYMKDSEICDNISSYNGGGIMYMLSSSVEVVESRINGNAAARHGGGLYCYIASGQTTSTTITDSELNGNTAGYDGGGIYTTRALTITGSELNGNTAVRHGGGIYTQGYYNCKISGGTMSGNTAADGGAIYTMTGYSYIRPDGVEFSGNTADTGYYWTVDDSASAGDSYNHRRYVTNCSYSTGPAGLPFTNAYNNYDIYYLGTETETEVTKAVTKIANAEGEDQTDLTVASVKDFVTYTITYKNQTAGKLLGVTIVDRLPEHVELTGIEPSGGYTLYGADGNLAGSFPEARVIEWDIGDMAYGAEGSIEITVRIPASASDLVITNAADMNYNLIAEGARQTNTEEASLRIEKDTTAEISLYYYEETEKGAATTWQISDPQPEPEPYYADIGDWFEFPDVVLEELYFPYFYTLSTDDHDEQFYFTDHTGFTVEEDVDVHIYCINTTVDIKIPAGNFLWYANADTVDGAGIYEIRSAEYDIKNESPSRFMELSVSIESFSEAAGGRTELRTYEDQILLDLYVTNQNGTQIMGDDGRTGTDLLDSGNGYKGTYADTLKSGSAWNYRFTGSYDTQSGLMPLPAEGAVSDYVLKLTFDKQEPGV